MPFPNSTAQRGPSRSVRLYVKALFRDNPSDFVRDVGHARIIAEFEIQKNSTEVIGLLLPRDDHPFEFLAISLTELRAHDLLSPRACYALADSRSRT